jgi:hypothetical protein
MFKVSEESLRKKRLLVEYTYELENNKVKKMDWLLKEVVYGA